MALYTGRLLMRGGNESDFDPDKMMPREWAVSTDKGVVRICIKPGVCIRMATYEAFEEDMVKIEEILEECQSIQEAVIRINTEVSQNADAVAEYTAQAKNYMESANASATNAKASEEASKLSETNAKSSETNAKLSEEHAQAVFESLPEDYGTLSKEFYEVAIKQTASGEDIHVTDSANAKVREFAMFGKAKQQTTSGKNFAENKAISETKNGLTFTVNEDKSITVNGTATATTYYIINSEFEVPKNTILNGCPSGGSMSTYFLVMTFHDFATKSDLGNGVLLHNEDCICQNMYIQVMYGATLTNAKFYPMISVDGGEYEPYTNGQPSPSPDFPQEIKVPDGNVVVKSCGKNLWNPLSKATNINGAERPGIYLPVGTYTVANNSNDYLYYRDIDNKNSSSVPNGSVKTVTFDKESIWNTVVETEDIQIERGEVATPFEPYKETTAIIPVTDFAGIEVSSGGNNVDKNGQEWLSDMIVKYADGSGERIQRVNRETFTVDDIWSATTVSNSPCVSTPKKTLKTDYVFGGNKLCNISTEVHIGDNNINIPTSLSLEEFKTAISGLTVEVFQPLSEPIVTPLTAEEIAEIEKLSMFYPVTNISNDADCGMEVTYLADSKLYIDNRLAQIEAALVNNI